MTKFITASAADLCLPGARGPARRTLLAFLRDMLAFRRQQRDLRALPPHLLNDVGITREEALHEAKKPVWNAPEYWRK